MYEKCYIPADLPTYFFSLFQLESTPQLSKAELQLWAAHNLEVHEDL